jgi:hypothetical protein
MIAAFVFSIIFLGASAPIESKESFSTWNDCEQARIMAERELLPMATTGGCRIR